VKRERHTEGFTLVELLLVIGLFALVITTMFTVVQALSRMTATSVDQSNMSRDLSYQLEVLSKTIMQGKVIYANDDVVFLRTRTNTGYRMNKVFVDTVTTNGVTRGRLVVHRWETNAAGTAPNGTYSQWVVSDRNGNLLTDPATPLITYFGGNEETDFLGTADKRSTEDTQVASFVGNLPGGYPVGEVMRLRLTAVTMQLNSESSGMLLRSDSRDVAVRPW
jgi:hypothetical protein